MTAWLTLIISLPTENATVRMRAWRTLKASGAAVLRDGVYLLPELPGLTNCRATLDAVAADVLAAGGSAFVLRAEEPAAAKFERLFDRSEAYGALLAEVAEVAQALSAFSGQLAQSAHSAQSPDSAPAQQKAVRRLRKAHAALVELDFFPGEAQRQSDAALLALELALARALDPSEPHAEPDASNALPLVVADYQGRTWATRARPRADRLASAWLIRRFIDPGARLLWLTDPASLPTSLPTNCPSDALGFDFDGATFTHSGNRVTFEVLLQRFGLQNEGLGRGLAKLAALVHYLDVGGVPVPEALGVEVVLDGLRCALSDDDALLAAACPVFDGLLAAFASTSAQRAAKND